MRIGEFLQLIDIAAADDEGSRAYLQAIDQNQPVEAAFEELSHKKRAGALFRTIQHCIEQSGCLATHPGLHAYAGRIKTLTSGSNPFQMLPRDIVNLILEYLSPKDVCSLFTTCRDMRIWREEFLPHPSCQDMVSNYILQHLINQQRQSSSQQLLEQFPQHNLFAQIMRQLPVLTLHFDNRLNDGLWMQVMQRFPNLQHADLSNAHRLTINSLQHITCLTNLQSLRLHDQPELALQHLSCLTNLEHLDLHGCDAGVQFDQLIRKLTKLQSLRLPNSVDDADLFYIATLYNLRELVLSGIHAITDTGIGYLSTLSQLRQLQIRSRMQISDTALQSLNISLPNLHFSRE